MWKKEIIIIIIIIIIIKENTLWAIFNLQPHMNISEYDKLYIQINCSEKQAEHYTCILIEKSLMINYCPTIFNNL